MPVIGLLTGRSLTGRSLDSDAHPVEAFRGGLSESGYVEGRNIAIEYRWAEGQYERLPASMSDLVRRQVAVIMAGGNVTALAAEAASTSIPIVFVIGAIPSNWGL
jgi:putative tryptophan/tyrosine transport system substrate-binding protein